MSNLPTLDEAEVLRKLAEADKFLAEASAAREEERLKHAEADQKEWHAIAAKHGAENLRVQTEATLRQEKLALAGDHHHHVFQFNGPVYADHPMYGDKSGECIAQLNAWHRLDPTCDMTVEFTSPGGNVVDGMALFDLIMSYSKRPWDTGDRPKGTHRTIGVIRGEAASMAGILIQAFDERVHGYESDLMIHPVSSWSQGSLGDLKDHMDHLEQLTERVKNIFVRRAKISDAGFKKLWDRKATYLDGQTALKHGLVDRIG